VDGGDWGTVVERAIAGDRRAYARLARLVTGHLAHWRAWDFHADWEDMVQEVILSVIEAHRDGRLSEPGAVRAYARQATRFKFIDRIRAQRRRGIDAPIEEDSETPDAHWPPAESVGSAAVEIRLSLWDAIGRLPERERLAVLEVHARGRTYEEAAAETGIPLGSLKRSLRAGLEKLRRGLEGAMP
jgi:RNA polymerase sigma-70 factor (ECF subfamily)